MDAGNGETAPPELPGFARGAGGKMRKPLNRKSRTTPYARPQPNQHQTPLAVRGGNGGWLSKIVYPACRLIGVGATRLMPSLFSRAPSIESPASSSFDEDHDNLQGEAEHEVDDENNQGISDLALARSTQSPNAESVEDDSKCGGHFDSKREDKSTDLPNADGLLEIEQLIEGKMFTRDEVDRLVEILHSKTADLPTGEGRDKQPAENVREEVRGPGIASDLASKLKEEKQEVLNTASREVLTPLPKSNLLNEIGASPVDIARAYMGHRMSETGDDGALVRLDGHSMKPFTRSSLHDSSIRWPGATVPNRYLTPQTQRSRYGLHDFRRTPYSRSIHSVSKSKRIQTGDDGNKSSGTVSPLLKQSHTVINLQANSRSGAGDGDYGSIGPIRRFRNKFSIGTPQKFDSFPPLASPSQREKTNLPLASLPTYRKSIDDRGKSNTMEPQWADDRPQSLDIGVPTVPRHSSQMASKILEHLDRKILTPKEKHAELKLATSWKKDIPSDSVSVGDGAISRENVEKCWNADTAHLHESRGTSSFKLQPERSTIRIAEPVGKRTSVFATDLRSSFPANGISSESANEVSKLAPTSTDSQSQDALRKPPVSAAKAGLSSLSTQKAELRPAFPSGNSSGFTFPVSSAAALFPEPPTPSLTPPPSLSNSHHLPEEEASITSFTFGSNRSSPALVFSFPSTSSSLAPVDVADLKFTFGSGERRISFASMGRDDGVCY